MKKKKKKIIIEASLEDELWADRRLKLAPS